MSSCGSSSCSSASERSEGNVIKANAVNSSLLENAVHNHNVGQEAYLLILGCFRLSSLSTKSSSVIGNDEDHEGFIDNSLALVPVTFPSTSQATTNHKPVNESVVEALEALRRAKQGIICSMGTRLMIKVGPT
ncbi:hypothetical protein RIF29_40042 [Crotalaria pallida]|uniref:Uncharacterized protein n=1 Tax=Crotalaria pallida TaxID=3830 RepID=A0AAN9HRA5_CROPI